LCSPLKNEPIRLLFFGTSCVMLLKLDPGCLIHTHAYMWVSFYFAFRCSLFFFINIVKRWKCWFRLTILGYNFISFVDDIT
jgi:hypothetical protein